MLPGPAATLTAIATGTWMISRTAQSSNTFGRGHPAVISMVLPRTVWCTSTDGLPNTHDISPPTVTWAELPGSSRTSPAGATTRRFVTESLYTAVGSGWFWCTAFSQSRKATGTTMTVAVSIATRIQIQRRRGGARTAAGAVTRSPGIAARPAPGGDRPRPDAGPAW